MLLSFSPKTLPQNLPWYRNTRALAAGSGSFTLFHTSPFPDRRHTMLRRFVTTVLIATLAAFTLTPPMPALIEAPREQRRQCEFKRMRRHRPRTCSMAGCENCTSAECARNRCGRPNPQRRNNFVG
jgi:hypothetical protein